MAIEIERKFLVNHEKWNHLKKTDSTYMRQGYIFKERRCTLRVRVTEQTAFITLKGNNEGIARKEFEYQIPNKDGIELLENFAESEIEKTRYRITVADKLWEVDVFAGENEGLIVAEIELKSENEVFVLPDWILAEVSNDARYYNSNLSVFPFKKW